VFELIHSLFTRIDSISTFSVLVYFLIKRPKTENAFYWFVGFILSECIFIIAAETQALYSKYHHIDYNNLPLFHLASILYVINLLQFFRHLFPTKTNKVIDIIFLISFGFLSIFNFIYLTRTFTIYGLTSIWVVIKCMFYYSHEFTNPTKSDILKSKIFWVVSGLFLYFSVCFFVFITYDYITFNPKATRILDIIPTWLIQNCVSTLSCGFFIKAIKCKE